MKLLTGLIVLVLSTSLSASEFHCIGQSEAVQAAENNIESLRTELHEVSSFWVPRQRVREYISRMDFDQNVSKYKTGVLAKWTCAAGSDCYVGIEVDCNGNTGTYLFAD